MPGKNSIAEGIGLALPDDPESSGALEAEIKGSNSGEEAACAKRLSCSHVCSSSSLG
jgi:hypothetical protein